MSEALKHWTWKFAHLFTDMFQHKLKWLNSAFDLEVEQFFIMPICYGQPTPQVIKNKLPGNCFMGKQENKQVKSVWRRILIIKA